MNLNTSIENLSAVGKTTAKRLQRIGLKTIADLLLYFPFRYDDFQTIKLIKDLVAGEQITVRGKVDIIANRRSWKSRKNITEALISDSSGSIKIVWFNQPFLTKTIPSGTEVLLSGKADDSAYGWQMTSPQYEKVRGGQETYHTGRLVPIYSLTDGLTEKQLRFLLSQAIKLVNEIPETLPEEILVNNQLMPINLALQNIHFPRSSQDLQLAERRWQFEEMFVIQLKTQKIIQDLKQTHSPSIAFNEMATKQLVDSLPFKLTNDQKKAAWEIIQDLGQSHSMNRLLEGDVGSGKTVVAALALLNVALSSYCGVMMAPTEILAVQHYQSLRKLLVDKNFPIVLLTRTRKQVDGEDYSTKELTEYLLKMERGVIVGTQALIQDKIKIKNLALVVVDEQHRFGVKQRQDLTKQRTTELTPHFLSMTATPIPRTLALALYSDLNLSIIKTLPSGRKPILSRLVEDTNRQAAYEFIRAQVKSGRQVFIICPLIDPSDKIQVRAVSEEFEKLEKHIFPDLRVKMLHGKLKAEEKNKLMANFANKQFDILVSTSVIEVGVDIPNATIMAIEGAERFGLAQLHQLRGRVGRGEYQSYCLLFSDNLSSSVRERLQYFVSCRDGFSLAEKDLSWRGAGEVFGARQSGLNDMKLDTFFDVNLVKSAQSAAKLFWEKYKLEDYPGLKEKYQGKEFIDHLE